MHDYCKKFGTHEQIFESKVPQQIAGELKRTMALLETVQMKCPWSEDEIKNVLHGEPWEGVSYTGARTRNPLCPPPPARAREV